MNTSAKTDTMNVAALLAGQSMAEIIRRAEDAEPVAKRINSRGRPVQRYFHEGNKNNAHPNTGMGSSNAATVVVNGIDPDLDEMGSWVYIREGLAWTLRGVCQLFFGK